MDGLKARIEKIKMDKVTRFFELKELWKQSSDRHVIDQQISELLDNMTKEETEQLTAGVQKDFNITLETALKDISNRINTLRLV